MSETWIAVGQLYAGCVLLVILLLGQLRPRPLARRTRPMTVQRREELMARLGDRPDVERLLRTGKKVQAIKWFRDETRASLPESVEMVNALAVRLGITDRPTAFGITLVVVGYLSALLLIGSAVIMLMR